MFGSLEMPAFLRTGLAKVGMNVGEGEDEASPSASQDAEATVMGLSYATRFKGWVICVFVAGLFMFLAFAIGLPVLALRPSKFALCFTMGSLLYMISFALLRGPAAHLASICSFDRLPFTSAYLGSMLGTLWASLIRRSQILTIFMASIQITSLAYYLVSYIPGGTVGLKYFAQAVAKTARHLCIPCITGFVIAASSRARAPCVQRARPLLALCRFFKMCKLCFSQLTS